MIQQLFPFSETHRPVLTPGPRIPPLERPEQLAEDLPRRSLGVAEASILLFNGKIGVSKGPRYDVVLDVDGGRLVLLPGTGRPEPAFDHAARVRRDLIRAATGILARHPAAVDQDQDASTVG